MRIHKQKLKNLVPKLQKGTYMVVIDENGKARALPVSTGEMEYFIKNVIGRY